MSVTNNARYSHIFSAKTTNNQAGRTLNKLMLSRKSILLIILLDLVTLNTYTYFWFFQKQREMQNNYQLHVLNPLWILLAMILQGIDWMLVLPGAYFGVIYYTEGEILVNQVHDILNLVCLVTMIVITFIFRSGLLKIFKIFEEDPIKINWFLTFIFGYFYLQYKINKCPNDQLMSNSI